MYGIVCAMCGAWCCECNCLLHCKQDILSKSSKKAPPGSHNTIRNVGEGVWCMVYGVWCMCVVCRYTGLRVV